MQAERGWLESDYCRIEIQHQPAGVVHAGRLESDYCRIEILHQTSSMLSGRGLESDYCRIEIKLARGNEAQAS